VRNGGEADLILKTSSCNVLMRMRYYSYPSQVSNGGEGGLIVITGSVASFVAGGFRYIEGTSYTVRHVLFNLSFSHNKLFLIQCFNIILNVCHAASTGSSGLFAA